MNTGYNESRGVRPLLPPRVHDWIDALPFGPWLLPDDQWRSLWRAPVGHELSGAIAAALFGAFGLVLAVFRLSVTGLLSAFAVLAVGAALWRWTISQVEATTRWERETRVESPTLIAQVDWLHFEPAVWLQPGDAYWTEGRTLLVRQADGTEREFQARARRPEDLR